MFASSFSRRSFVFACLLSVCSSAFAQSAQAMGDVSLPTLTFPDEAVVTQGTIVLLPVPSQTGE